MSCCRFPFSGFLSSIHLLPHNSHSVPSSTGALLSVGGAALSKLVTVSRASLAFRALLQFKAV